MAHRSLVQPAPEPPYTTDYILQQIDTIQMMIDVFSRAPNRTLARNANHRIDMAHWADESSENIEPRPHLESFYTLVALQFGDPEGDLWLHQHLIAFREMYEQWCKTTGTPRESSNAIVLSYFIWYPRQLKPPVLDTHT